jgi:hypothetical protein
MFTVPCPTVYPPEEEFTRRRRSLPAGGGQAGMFEIEFTVHSFQFSDQPSP